MCRQRLPRRRRHSRFSTLFQERRPVQGLLDREADLAHGVLLGTGPRRRCRWPVSVVRRRRCAPSLLLSPNAPVQRLCTSDPCAGLTQALPGPPRTCERQRKSFRGGWASVPGRLGDAWPRTISKFRNFPRARLRLALGNARVRLKARFPRGIVRDFLMKSIMLRTSSDSLRCLRTRCRFYG